MTLSPRWLARMIRPEARGQLIDWRGVPAALRTQASAVVRNPREAEDLVLFYGSPNFQPAGGVVLMCPGQPPVYISHVRRTEDAADPVGLTAAQLRDIAANMWWALIAEVMDDPDLGRFNIDTFMRTPEAYRWRVIERSRLARILVDAQNKVLHPERQPWQPATVGIVR